MQSEKSGFYKEAHLLTAFKFGPHVHFNILLLLKRLQSPGPYLVLKIYTHQELRGEQKRLLLSRNSYALPLSYFCHLVADIAPTPWAAQNWKRFCFIPIIFKTTKLSNQVISHRRLTSCSSADYQPVLLKLLSIVAMQTKISTLINNFSFFISAHFTWALWKLTWLMYGMFCF